MIALGLDLSLKSTGYCFLYGDRDGHPLVSAGRIPKELTPGVKERISVLASIADELVRLIKTWSPNIIVIEAQTQGQVYQAASIGELHGVIKHEIFMRTGIVPWVEQATKLRKLVVGSIEKQFIKTTNSKGKSVRKVHYGFVEGKSGRQKSATIKDIIEQRLQAQGLKFQSQDEMDAYVAAKFGWDLLRTGQ